MGLFFMDKGFFLGFSPSSQRHILHEHLRTPRREQKGEPTQPSLYNFFHLYFSLEIFTF